MPKKMLNDRALIRFMREAPMVEPTTPPAPMRRPRSRLISPDRPNATDPAMAMGMMAASEVAVGPMSVDSDRHQ